MSSRPALQVTASAAAPTAAITTVDREEALLLHRGHLPSPAIQGHQWRGTPGAATTGAGAAEEPLLPAVATVLDSGRRRP